MSATKRKSASVPKVDLVKVVDDLGMIKAQISTLCQQERDLKAILVAEGVGEYEGNLFRATVSQYDQERLDMDAVYSKLSDQFIKNNTTVIPVTKVNVVARIPSKPPLGPIPRGRRSR